MKITIKTKEQICGRDDLHIIICEKYPARKTRVKKGKGSYRRRPKHKKDLREAD